MRRNGEAIYGTRRWRATHEGPTTVAMAGTREREEKGFEARFTPQDIWYTLGDGTVYAIALVPPDGNQIVLSALADDAPERVAAVRLLGAGTPVRWSRDESGLKVLLPDRSVGERGYALAIELE
jgi:alpha-L-fucosidase